jgi:hypothetical protein
MDARKNGYQNHDYHADRVKAMKNYDQQDRFASRGAGRAKYGNMARQFKNGDQGFLLGGKAYRTANGQAYQNYQGGGYKGLY